MSTQEIFYSPLADALADFVAFKRMQGYDYCSQAAALKPFDRFLTDRDCSDGLLHEDMFTDYLAATASFSPSTREGRLGVVRQFSHYLHAHCPDSAVVPAGMLPRRCRSLRFCRIEPEQVHRLMQSASTLDCRHPVVPSAIRFLIGLLYCTGLRVGEALSLDMRDVDLQRGTLSVRNGKFGKDRLLALTDSAVEAVRAWLELRSDYAAAGPDAPFLAGGSDSRLTKWQVRRAFRTLRERCGLDGDPPARLHDLRHNFACRCIARWRESGQDVQALLPVLANAMGHVNVFTTQVYIHVDAGALQQASEKLSNHVSKLRENRK